MLMKKRMYSLYNAFVLPFESDRVREVELCQNATSNLDTTSVGVVVSNLGDCGSTSNDFKDSGFSCVAVTTTLDPHLCLPPFAGGVGTNSVFQPHRNNYLYVGKAQIFASPTPTMVDEMKAGNQ